MIYARIAGDRVAELIEAADAEALAARFHPGLVAQMIAIPPQIAVEVGWVHDHSGFGPPPQLPTPIPATITRPQLLLQLAAMGLITAAEALAAAQTGAVPPAIDAVFAALPAEEALAARITWATMLIVERAHPLVGILIAAGLADADQVDALFIGAAAR